MKWSCEPKAVARNPTHKKATLTNGPFAVTVSKEAESTALRTSKNAPEKGPPSDITGYCCGSGGMSQGQGHPVVHPHKGAAHPTQQTPGLQGKLGVQLALG